MKFLPPPKAGERSAALAQTLWLMAVCSVIFTMTAYASTPGWWTSRGAVNPALGTNNYAVVTQGQLKRFTQKAVQEMNTNLPGGAGSDLNGIVSNWIAQYTTNGYNATNLLPADSQAMTVGQVKYIANKVYSKLIPLNYAVSYPWLNTNTTDSQLATVSQLKTVFDFDLSAPKLAQNLTVTLSGTSAFLSWSDPSSVTTYTLQQSTDGGLTWTDVGTISGALTTNTVTGLTLGGDYQFRLIANGASSSSPPSLSEGPPAITLTAPTGATLVP